MPRTKIDYAFTGEVIDSTHPTASGRWYAESAIDDIVKSVIDGKKYIIQEYSPLEREIKKNTCRYGMDGDNNGNVHRC